MSTDSISYSITDPTFDILVIAPNNFTYDSNTHGNTFPTLAELRPYFRLISTTRDELMYLLYDLLELTPETVGDSDLVYENDKLIYQIFHNSENYQSTEEEGKLIKLNNSNKTSLNNGIATYLTNSVKNIRGVCVLVSSKILPNYLCDVESVTYQECYDLLMKTLVHKGNIISVDGNISTFMYQNPTDGIESKNIANYSFVEADIYNFHLIGCFNSSIVCDKSTFNKKASLLFDTVITGDLRICLAADTRFIDIEDNLIDNLLYCSLQKAERKYVGMEDMGERSGGMTVIKNSYTLLKRKLHNYAVKCCDEDCNETCSVNSKQIESYKYRCQQCLKAFYHDESCMIKNLESHKTSCLIGNLLQSVSNDN